MSGGVDSSVTALTLLEQGYHVEGLFMKNWEEEDPDSAYCPALIDMKDAQQVCDELEIPLHKVNFSKEYWDRVFQHFLDEYSAGRTPNPDVMCNKEIKFKAFLDHALGLGADYIATGHYVRRVDDEDGRVHLYQGADKNKDQSYFLHTLGQAELSRALFPIGEMDKSHVREMAMNAGFDNHEKKDSTGICFIGERRFRDFLSQYLPAQPGKVEDLEGTVLGDHNGLMYYTIGQRQGIGIGGLRNSDGEPWYVVEKDLERNVLKVAQGSEHPALFKTHLDASQLYWVNQAPDAPLRCEAKIRYRQTQQPCTIEQIDGSDAVVVFDEPQRAITEGQSVVFYSGEDCLGGGIIERAFNGDQHG
ncbi:tRNA (5-methylaminomethyl-2-thiouridylate)-methyltransferase [gamma proteobacterium HTCC5015]|nr:tRNA (5-methylaminomethyl-2-thiouridylate)-methyltransferase [gamma proteobacterium HTCC5015]